MTTTRIESDTAMRAWGQQLGKHLHGGEVIELIGDVGAGKTTLTKGIAAGLGVDDPVQSPSFTISRQYEGRNGLRLVHYDFYRLTDAGVMAADVADTAASPDTVTVVEWAGPVEGVLPADRMVITIDAVTDTVRRLTLRGQP